MKYFFLAILLASLTGCGTLFPKRVEFFQDKVEKVPTAKRAEKETQRQAAQRAAEKADETLNAALLEDASPAVVDPARETGRLTDAVSRSLGPPISPSSITSEELARKLEKAVASLNRRLEDFREESDKNAGRKIEGSGLIKVPYFLWLGIVGAVLFVIYIVLKTFVNVAAAGSPPVALGLQAVRLGGRGVAAMAKEVIHGGQKFREKLANSKISKEVQEEIEELFQNSQREAQSPETQDAVKKLIS